MPNFWIITNGPTSPVIGNDLNGYKIKQTTNGFELYPQNPNAQRVAKVDQTTLPVTFEDVTIAGQTWDITVDKVPSTTDAGTWVTPSQATMRPEDVPPQSGEFTAQVGGSLDEEAAASAGHGKP